MMTAEMYARVVFKPQPEDNLNPVKVINVVDVEGQPMAMGQGPQGPKGDPGPQGERGPQGPAGPAGHDAQITKAAHVDPTSGTVEQVVNALIAAGLMASA